MNLLVLSRLCPPRSYPTDHHISIRDIEADDLRAIANDAGISEWARERAEILYYMAQGQPLRDISKRTGWSEPDLKKLRYKFWNQGLPLFRSSGKGRPALSVPTEAIETVVRLYLWGKSIPAEDWTAYTVVRSIEKMTGQIIGYNRATKILKSLMSLREGFSEEELINLYGGPLNGSSDQSA